MKVLQEHQNLLQTVKVWFHHHEQIAHYRDTVEEGLSAAEKWLLSSLGSRQSILDIGCGAGRVAFALVQEGRTITGVDISHELLRIAKDYSQINHLPINLVQIDALQLPFQGDTFDLALAIKVYCYIPSKALRVQYIQEIARVLQPGGILAMIQYVTPAEWISSAYDETYHRLAPKYATLEEGDTFAFIEDSQTHGYVHWFTEQELREELEEAGLISVMNTNDRNHGGEGYMQLIVLQKPT